MLYLLHGGDAFRAEVFLKGKMPGDADVVVLAGDELDGETLARACQVIPMFGQEHWVVVKGYPPSSAFLPLKTLAESGSSMLRLAILVAEELHEGDRLLTLVRQHGEVYLFRPFKKQDAIAWIQQQAEKMGLDIEPGVAELVWEVAGSDLAMACSELEKLLSYSGGARLSRQEAAAVVGQWGQERLWNLFDALKLQDVGEALKRLNRMMSQGIDAAQILAGLSSYLRRVLAAAELRGSDEELVRAIETLERRAGSLTTVETWQVRNYRQHASRISREQLHGQYTMLAVADELLKSTSLSSELILDLLISYLAGGPDARLEELLESYR